MNSKLRVAIIFGGQSVEHEVSLLSARSVIETIDKGRFEVIPIGITKSGRWLSPADSMRLLQGEDPDHADLHLVVFGSEEFKGFIRVKDPALSEESLEDEKNLRDSKKYFKEASQIDVAFPLIHGAYGEDGRLQGILEMAHIPYVGSGPLSSALGMDKDMMKRLFKNNGIPIPDYQAIYWSQWEEDRTSIFDSLLEKFSFPLFVKPSHSGSGVGISKAKDIGRLDQAIEEAFRYDNKIIVEKAIDAREIECSILGNENPMASVPGEVIPCHEFYDYKAKYIDEGSELIIPARLSKKEVKSIQDLSVKAFKTLECNGMARVDMLLEKDLGQIYVNELNTIPGFTPISMYPKLLEASGIPYRDLITRLIQLAMEKHEKEDRLETSFKMGVD